MNNIQAVIDRAVAAFAVPGARVSVEELQRLCGVDYETAEMVLEFLVDTKVVSRTSTYALLARVDNSSAPATVGTRRR